MPTDNRRLLLADDDRLILATLGRGLRDVGFDVIEAVSGEEAVHLAKEKSPDLAILDVRMPGLSGIETAQRLRRETTVPFIFLSAYGDTDVVKQAAVEGALGYLLKPIDVPQMVPLIEAALARAAEIRALRANEAHLNTALAAGRETSVAVGLLMERKRLTLADAFETLRSYARSQRRKVQDVAGEMVRAAELLNSPKAAPRKGKPPDQNH